LGSAISNRGSCPGNNSVLLASWLQVYTSSKTVKKCKAHITCHKTCHAAYFERSTECLLLPVSYHGCCLSYKDHAPSVTSWLSHTMLPALHQVCHIKTMLLHRLAVLYYSILPKPGHLISPHRSPLLTRLLPQNLCYAKPVPFVSFPYLNFTPDLFALQTWVLSISNYLKLS